jgi:hypothetical protein
MKTIFFWDDRHLTLQASNYIEIILMIGRIMGCEFPSTNPVFLSSKQLFQANGISRKDVLPASSTMIRVVL